MASIVKSLRILGDTNRLRMVLLLAREELSVAELQEILGMGQSTISTHLAQLKHAGLVEDRRTGKNIWYRFKQESGVSGLLTLLEEATEEIPEGSTARRRWSLFCANGRTRRAPFLMIWPGGWAGSMFRDAPGRVSPRPCCSWCRPW